MSLYSYNYCDFQRFLLFRNKARNAGRSGKNAGMREINQNAGFPARLTPDTLEHFISETRKTKRTVLKVLGLQQRKNNCQWLG